MFPEREKKAPEGVVEIPQVPEIPEHIEKGGVSAVPQHFTAQVKQGGQSLITTPQDSTVVISIPSDQNSLTQMSKGNISDSLTWFSTFWLRIIKKAMYFGWKLVLNQKQ